MTSAMGKPETMPWLSPYLIAKDLEKTIAFYEKAFGFKLRNVFKDENGTANHAEMDYHDQVVMVGQEGEYEGRSHLSPITKGTPDSLTLYLYCEDVDELCQQAKSHGAKIILSPHDTHWGDRMSNLEDIDGYRWAFATNKAPCTQTNVGTH